MKNVNYEKNCLILVFISFVITCKSQGCQSYFISTSLGNTFYFYNSSSGYAGNHWYWTFGDGSSDTGQNVQHTYNASGVYQVCLTIQDSVTNCYDQYCDSVLVSGSAGCQASFTNALQGLSATFTSTSQNYYGSYYHWDFGDNTIGNGHNTTHIYSSAGWYNICLTIQDSVTNCYDQYCDSIHIGVSNPCQSAFTYTIQGTTLAFVDASQNYSGNHWYWTFGDNSNGTGQYLTHTYNSPGWYYVCLSIYDSSTNCYDQYCDSIYVGVSNPCQAAFTYTTQGTTLAFVDASQNYSGNHWYWTFGDNSNGTGQYLTHTYNSPGWYYVCLSIYDTSTNCYDQYCDSIYIGSSHSCQAAFTYTMNGTTVTFVDTSINFFGNHWFWTFGDNTSGTHQYPTHTYSTPGWYLVCLTIYDSISNCYDQHCDSILVDSSHPCQASFTFTMQGNTIAFVDASQNYSGNYWYWTFGDGGHAIGQNATHTYTSAGLYTVCLTIQDSATNCYDYYCDSFQIGGNTPCNAFFTYSINGNVATFTDSSSYSGNLWLWTFGDSTSGVGSTVHHTYNYTGNYQVCLIIHDSASNCYDQFCDTISIIVNSINKISEDLFFSKIYPNPIIDFANVELSIIKPIDVQYKILDQVGHVVYSNFQSLKEGLNTIEINTSYLSKGIYYLQISSTDRIEIRRKLVKIK